MLDGNAIIGIWERDFDGGMVLDKRAGFMFGEGTDSMTAPSNATITNNLVAGAFFAGFTAPSSECGDSPSDL